MGKTDSVCCVLSLAPSPRTIFVAVSLILNFFYVRNICTSTNLVGLLKGEASTFPQWFCQLQESVSDSDVEALSRLRRTEDLDWSRAACTCN